MAGDLIIDLARAGGERAWRGCTLAANHASYYHDAHDFASITLCGLPLTGLREDRVTSAMRECPACARVAAEHAGHGADDCPLPRPLPRTAFYDRMTAARAVLAEPPRFASAGLVRECSHLLFNNDETDFDAPLADELLQFMLLGEIVYG